MVRLREAALLGEDIWIAVALPGEYEGDDDLPDGAAPADGARGPAGCGSRESGAAGVIPVQQSREPTRRTARCIERAFVASQTL